VRVLVTGTGGTGVGAGIVAALENTYWYPVAADAHPFSWGLYAAPEGVLLPWADDPGYLDAVLKVIAGTGAQAVIPGTEQETVLLTSHRDLIPVPVIGNNAWLMPMMRDKNLAQVRLAELGFRPVPALPWAQRDQAGDVVGFPVVVKPSCDTSGSRGVYLVTGPGELEALAPLVRPSTIIQPYLADARHEYTVGVLSARNGDIIDSIVIRRELTGVSLLQSAGDAAVSTGFSQGVIVRDQRIQDYCETLASKLGSAGPMNFQIRVTDEAIWVFEVHPRFSFSAPLRAAAGFNEADALLRHWLHGEQPGRLDYRTDVAVIRSFDQIVVPVSEMLS